MLFQIFSLKLAYIPGFVATGHDSGSLHIVHVVKSVQIPVKTHLLTFRTGKWRII